MYRENITIDMTFAYDTNVAFDYFQGVKIFGTIKAAPLAFRCTGLIYVPSLAIISTRTLKK